MKRLFTTLLLFLFLISFQSNAQVSWKNVSGEDSHAIERFAVHPNGTIFAAEATSLNRSTDNGETWEQYHGNFVGTIGTGVSKAFAINSSGYLFTLTNDGLVRSTNNGEDWAAAATGLENETGVLSIAAPYSGDNMFCGGVFDIYMSTNNGESWTSILTNEGMALFTNILVTPTGRVIAGGWAGGLYYSDDYTNWNQPGNADLQDNIIDLYMAATGEIYVIRSDAESTHANTKLYKSTDNGTSWNLVYENTEYDYLKCIVANGPFLLLGTMGDGVLLSINGGASWMAANDGLNMEQSIKAFGYTLDGALLLSTSNYIFKSGAVSSVKDSPFNDYTDVEVTPNPADENTTVKFNLDRPVNMNIFVSDIEGRKYLTVSTGQQFNKGENSISIETTSLQPGTYFINFESEGTLKSTKVKVVR